MSQALAGSAEGVGADMGRFFYASGRWNKMKNEEISVSKFIQNLVKKHYEKENI